MYIALKGNATMLTTPSLCLDSSTDILTTQIGIKRLHHAARVGHWRRRSSVYSGQARPLDRTTQQTRDNLRRHQQSSTKAQRTMNMVPSVLTLACAGLNKIICQYGLATERTVSILANIHNRTWRTYMERGGTGRNGIASGNELEGHCTKNVSTDVNYVESKGLQ